MINRPAWQPRRAFFWLLLVTLAFRGWLSAALPMTGDEAYFVWWGAFPDLGFYDHPPMIGWWMTALQEVSHATWWLRLPSTLQPAILALAIAGWLLPYGRNIAWGAALLVLLAPVNVWNVLITNDTALVYFCVTAMLGWLYARRAEAENRSPWLAYTVAGLGLAGAVLSKYFAVFIGAAFFLDAFFRPNRHKLLGFALVCALTLPGIGLMAWWNAGHCWPNVMFNFYNRNTDLNSGWSWQTPLLYLSMMVYMLTPAFFWHRWRQQRILPVITHRREARALGMLALLPLFLLAGLALVKKVGLHWVLAFVPLTLAWLATRLEQWRLRMVVNFFIGFAWLHMIAVVALSFTSLERWQHSGINTIDRSYDSLVLTFDAPAVLDALAPYQDYVWMMDGYSNASILGYNTYRRNPEGKPRYVGVFGEGSFHARQDDILTDFRTLDGRNIAILQKGKPRLDTEFAPYFAEVDVQQFTVRGATFHLVLGRGFNFAAYRDEVLAPIRARYYALPPSLPQTACYFCERYFPGVPCLR